MWKLNQARSLSIRVRGGDGGAKSESTAAKKIPRFTYRTLSDSYPAQLRALFWIAVSNFVFPIFFDIAQYILIFRDTADYNVYMIVLITNIYVEIIGVLFATVWAATKHSESPDPRTESKTLQFGRNMASESRTMNSGNDVNIVRTDDSSGLDKGEKKQHVLGDTI